MLGDHSTGAVGSIGDTMALITVAMIPPAMIVCWRFVARRCRPRHRSRSRAPSLDHPGSARRGRAADRPHARRPHGGATHHREDVDRGWRRAGPAGPALRGGQVGGGGGWRPVPSPAGG
jgi:hypothetical protein